MKKSGAQLGGGGPTKPRNLDKNQAGRPTAAELARRKGVVMQVATDLFVDHGYAGTSLVDVARGAGVATRTLYQHFGDKEALFREVIFARDTGIEVAFPTYKSGDALLEALTRAAEYARAITYDARAMGLMRLMIAESARFPGFMQRVGTGVFARFRRHFERLLSELATAGLIPDGDHARSAELFIDLVLGSHPIMAYTNWDSAPPSDADLTERVELFVRGRFDKAPAKGATRQTDSVQAA